MSPEKNAPKTIDEYISGFPDEIQQILETLRATIRAAAPEAVETISYLIPTYTLNGKNLVHFAAFKNHIGFYPGPGGIRAFAGALSAFASSKGTVRFPINQALPLDTVAGIVKFRVQENMERDSLKKQLSVKQGFDSLAAPARRALENNGIHTPQELAQYSEAEILKFHGMGRSSIPKLQQLLAENGLTFKH